MWCWRRMEKIKWLQKVTNEQVLGRIGKKRTFLKNLDTKKIGAEIFGEFRNVMLEENGENKLVTESN